MATKGFDVLEMRDYIDRLEARGEVRQVSREWSKLGMSYSER